jgi:hypothetical protein
MDSITPMMMNITTSEFFLFLSALANSNNNVGEAGAKFVGDAIAKCVKLNSLILVL